MAHDPLTAMPPCSLILFQHALRRLDSRNHNDRYRSDETGKEQVFQKRQQVVDQKAHDAIIVVLCSRGIKEKHGLLKSVLSAQHSLQSLVPRAGFKRAADPRFSQHKSLFLMLDCDGAAALYTTARPRR